jgi:hypothetical protein
MTNHDEVFQSLKEILKTAGAERITLCTECGLPMGFFPATFYFDDEAVETLLPYCPRCGPSNKAHAA